MSKASRIRELVNRNIKKSIREEDQMGGCCPVCEGSGIVGGAYKYPQKHKELTAPCRTAYKQYVMSKRPAKLPLATLAELKAIVKGHESDKKVPRARRTKLSGKSGAKYNDLVKKVKAYADEDEYIKSYVESVRFKDLKGKGRGGQSNLHGMSKEQLLKLLSSI